MYKDLSKSHVHDTRSLVAMGGCEWRKCEKIYIYPSLTHVNS